MFVFALLGATVGTAPATSIVFPISYLVGHLDLGVLISVSFTEI